MDYLKTRLILLTFKNCSILVCGLIHMIAKIIDFQKCFLVIFNLVFFSLVF
jgi:hypothetical protein